MPRTRWARSHPASGIIIRGRPEIWTAVPLAAMSLRYVGSGPYCYANSLAMVLGAHSADPSAIEVLTGSPYGACLLDGVTPFFDPPGWDPEIGLDAAIDLLGWRCVRVSGGTAAEARFERPFGQTLAVPENRE